MDHAVDQIRIDVVSVTDGIDDLVQGLRFRRQRKLRYRKRRDFSLKTFNLVASEVDVSGLVRAQVKTRHRADGLAPLVVDGKTVVQDCNVGAQSRKRQKQQAKSKPDFSQHAHAHALVVAAALPNSLPERESKGQ